MARCPSCDYPLPEDRDRLGARCPSCRDPLYDPPSRLARPVRSGEAACAVHAGNESIGTCGRCGKHYCETCRSRWVDQILCSTCVQRAMDAGAGTSQQVRMHFRQAMTSLLLGLASWLLGLIGSAVVGIVMASSGTFNLVLALFFVVYLLGIGVAALFGLGQGAAAIRIRGSYMLLATSGLILNGLFLGALIGMMTHTFW